MSTVEMMVVSVIVTAVAALTLHSLLQAWIRFNEEAAQHNLRVLAFAEKGFRDVQIRYASGLEELVNSNPPYIHEALGDGRQNGYDFQVAMSTPTAYAINATPYWAGISGVRTFCIDNTGEVTLGTYDTSAGVCTGASQNQTVTTEPGDKPILPPASLPKRTRPVGPPRPEPGIPRTPPAIRPPSNPSPTSGGGRRFRDRLMLRTVDSCISEVSSCF